MLDVDLIEKALKLAGEISLTFFRNNVKSWTKQDGSVLTEADLAVNDAVHTLLQEALLEDGWLSEEGPDDPTRLSKNRCWIVDPIDGTRSFSHGRDEWCIGMCLVENGQPIVAGVLHPSIGKLFLAQKGLGAKLNGKRIQVNDAATLDGAKIAGRPAALRRIAATHSLPVDVSHTPQIARLTMLAASEVDVVASFGLKHDWDIAPGALLVTEAGGKITDETGQPMLFNRALPRQNGLVASGVLRHGVVMKAMEKNV